MGWTPLVKAPRLGAAIGVANLFLKDDSRNPSLSFKDRPVAVALARALELGLDTLACASTGNLAGSVAAAAARNGLRALVFVPATTDEGKIAGAAAYGATVVRVNGTYDQVNRLCARLADEERWGFVNFTLRPYYAEGSKTLLFECAEQLGWRLPDHVVIPVGSGALLTRTATAAARSCAAPASSRKALSGSTRLSLPGAHRSRTRCSMGTVRCVRSAIRSRWRARSRSARRRTATARSRSSARPADRRDRSVTLT